MVDLASEVESLKPLTEREKSASSSAQTSSSLIIAIPSNIASLQASTQTMMKALVSKYMASQELEDDLDAHRPEADSLSSSTSSWHSSVSASTTNPSDGVQVIGAMGGKSIEFHRPKLRESHVLSGLLQEHPHISLYNMSISAFSSEDSALISLDGLKSLDLSSNFVSSWPLHVAPALASSPTITTLNLSSNPIQNIDAVSLQQRSHDADFATRAFEWLSSTSEKDQLCVHVFKSAIPVHYPIQTPLEVPASFLLQRELFVPAPSLTTLVLNKTGISWPTFLLLVSSLPVLTEAHVCLNRWTSLSPPQLHVDQRLLGSGSLEVLNLDSNMLIDFGNVTEALSTFPNLSKLVLSNNLFSEIPETLQVSSSHPFSRISREGAAEKPWSISLSSTRIESWSSLRKLASLVPELSEIRWQRNRMLPLSSLVSLLSSTSSSSSSVGTSSSSTASSSSSSSSSPSYLSDQVCRHYVVAMCPKVTSVNGSSIAEAERKDSERLFLVHYFGALPRSRLPNPLPSDPTSLIQQFALEDATIARLWNSQRNVTMEAFHRAFPTSSAPSSSSAHGDGITMLDITFSSENAEVVFTRKLPASTSVARLRAIITASFTTPQQRETYENFQICLMEPSSIGPPAFYPLTSDQTTLAQETTRLKVSILIKPKV